MAHWLAFDIGTTGTKAALLDADGRTIRSAYRDYPTHSRDGGVMEQDARQWWAAACEAAREVEAGAIEGIVLTGQMQDVILIDAQGEPTGPVILYSDSRAVHEAGAVQAAIGADHLMALTGNTQEAGSLLAKLLWLQSHQPLALDRAAHLLTGAADYLAFKLTGVAATDTTTASTTGLMELENRTWLPPDLLKVAGIQATSRLLPRLVAGGTHIGKLHEPGAAACGVPAGTPVYLGPGDAGAATLGAGGGAPGTPYAYIGTSGWVAFTGNQRSDPASGAFNLAHPLPGQVICVAPLLTAGGNLDWIKRVTGAESHAGMIEAAIQAPPSNLLYLPYLNGERSPFSDPFARGAFIGLNSSHTQADLTRAVLEGVACAYRHALDSLINTPVSRLILTGGGTRSAGWNQLIADVIGVDVAIAEDAANVGLRGALLAAQVGRGERSSYGLESVPVNAVHQPASESTAHYTRKYGWFRQAYPALNGLFREMGTAE
jgi:xylulokinase